jgi:hypothetical protein
MFDVPRPPVPMNPRLTRSDGGTSPSPNALDATIHGAPTAAQAPTNRRRVIRLPFLYVIMVWLQCTDSTELVGDDIRLDDSVRTPIVRVLRSGCQLLRGRQSLEYRLQAAKKESRRKHAG